MDKIKYLDEYGVSIIADEVQKALESKADQESEITFAEYSQFPSIGEINKLYIALDEKSSYIWDGDSYVKISGESTSDIKLINGGSAIDE